MQDRRRASTLERAPAAKVVPRADISETLADQFRNFPAADLQRRIEASKGRARATACG